MSATGMNVKTKIKTENLNLNSNLTVSRKLQSVKKGNFENLCMSLRLQTEHLYLKSKMDLEEEMEIANQFSNLFLFQ